MADDPQVPAHRPHAAAGADVLGADQVLLLQQVLLRHAPPRLPPHHLLLPLPPLQHRLRVPLHRGRVHLGRLRPADGLLLAHGHRRPAVLAADGAGVVPGAIARRPDKLPEGKGEGEGDEDQSDRQGFEAAKEVEVGLPAAGPGRPDRPEKRGLGFGGK